MQKARHRQVGTWPLCLSAFQCVCGVNIYFTLIYTSKGKKDVSVTFSKCQVWRGEERIRRERVAGDLGDLSMYALHNLFIYPGETESALYQKHTDRFTLPYTPPTQRVSHCISTFLAESKKLLCALQEELRAERLVQGHLELCTSAGFKLAAFAV